MSRTPKRQSTVEKNTYKNSLIYKKPPQTRTKRNTVVTSDGPKTPGHVSMKSRIDMEMSKQLLEKEIRSTSFVKSEQQDDLLLPSTGDLMDEFKEISDFSVKCNKDYMETVEEKWTVISKFLSFRDLARLQLTNKKMLEMVLDEMVKRNERDIAKFPVTAVDSSFNFEFDKKTQIAKENLDSINPKSTFDPLKQPSSKVIRVYRVIEYLLGNKEALTATADTVWRHACQRFSSVDKIGSFLEENLKIHFSSETVIALDKAFREEIMTLIPSKFTDNCAITGFILFFLKDIVEYLGFSHYKGKITGMCKQNIELLKTSRYEEVKQFEKTRNKMIL